MKRALTAAALLVALAVPGSAVARSVTVVRIRDIEFNPVTVRVHRGDSVTWRWLDGTTPHNVTSRGKQRFRSSSTRQRGAYTVRFTRAGTYRYVCTIHFTMKAKVVVS